VLVILPVLHVDRPHEDLAQPCRDRPHFGVDAFGQRAFGIAQPLGNLRAREIDIGRIGEDRGDLSKAVAAERARAFEPGNPRQRGFDREGDLPFDLLGRQRGRACGDLDLIIGDVGNGVDRQTGQGPGADQRGDGGDEQHEPAPRDREIDDGGDHVSGPHARLRPWRARPSG
jgi:hypothetical protein